jgi:hypothetical protein
VWTIDGAAPHAGEVQPGKVLFVSSFGAGRVLGVDQVGADLRVALGPVALTDLIQDGTFATSTPIPLTGFQAHSVPDRPGLDTPLVDDATGGGATDGSAPPDSSGGFRSSGFAAPRPSVTPTLPPLPPPSPDIPQSEVGSWNLLPECCTSIGVHVSYDKNGARVRGTASLTFEQPSVTFDLSITAGKLLDASVQLHGAASLSFDIEAAVKATSSDFHGGRIEVPVDLAIPVPIGNVPVTIGIQQIFSVSLGLGGEAAMGTKGEYALSGALGFTLKNGTVSADVPTLTTTKSALDSIHTLSVAPSALTFAYAVKVTVGVGPPLLSAGIWYQVSAALGIASSGPPGVSLVECKTVTLSVSGRYGVGYKIPDLVATALNLFLSTVMKHPPAPIQPTGGKSWGPTSLFEKSTPPCSK